MCKEGVDGYFMLAVTVRCGSWCWIQGPYHMILTLLNQVIDPISYPDYTILTVHFL